jgi:hypothetical protein
MAPVLDAPDWMMEHRLTQIQRANTERSHKKTKANEQIKQIEHVNTKKKGSLKDVCP